MLRLFLSYDVVGIVPQIIGEVFFKGNSVFF